MYNYNEMRSAQTSLGIPERWERVLAYAFGWISGLILLLVEHRNQTVRRHAVQSVVIFGVLSIIGLVLGILTAGLGWIPVLGWLTTGLFGILAGTAKAVSFGLWIVLMVLAFVSPKTILTGPRYERFF